MKKTITYSSSGVDISAADDAKRKIAALAEETFSENVLTKIGLFAGAYHIGNDELLLASADGVGTKTIIAAKMGIYDTVGIDLVHHCANDLIVHNADPIFLLDYIGHSNLTPEKIVSIVKGIVAGCKNAGCSLIGGETAQMPNIYPDDCFDLVGFIVGKVERSKMITGAGICPGDAIIGLPSNGLHTNGYSLARKVIFEIAGFNMDKFVDDLGETVGEALLKPHTLYIERIKLVRDKVAIKGMAHITGGGISGNLVRILPPKCVAIIKKHAAPAIPIFSLISQIGQIEEEEMFRTFNMGFGFLIIVAHDDVGQALKILGSEAFIAGEILAGERDVILSKIS